MLNKYKITNVSPIGVTIEDMGVYLPGRGNSSIVNSDLVRRSQDLLEVRELVRIDEVRVPKSMPIWPFHKVDPPKEEIKETPEQHDFGDIGKDIRAIKLLLAELLSRPSVPSAEVVAAHLQVAHERRELLKSGELPLVPEDPMFIPSSILPNDVETDIRTRDAEVSHEDFEGDLAALKKALKNK